VAIGHAIVELPLMVAMFYGLGYLLDQFYAQVGIALVGGVVLLVMGIGMLRNIKEAEVASSADDRSPLVGGILLTIGNPYFLVWWATVGATLISRAARFGIAGLVIFAVLHWLCDLMWLYLLSVLSFNGGRFLGRRFQTIIFAISGVVLTLFGVRFVADAIGRLIA